MNTDRTAIVHDLAGPPTYANSPRQLRGAVWIHGSECYVVRYLPDQWQEAVLAIDQWPLSKDDRYKAARQVLHTAMLDGFRKPQRRKGFLESLFSLIGEMAQFRKAKP